MNSIYLDNASTTKPVEGLISAITPYIEMKWENPSSLYSKGMDIKENIDGVRGLIAREIRCFPEEIFFTSGASESNSWVFQGFIKNVMKKKRKPVIVTSMIEHHSIIECVMDMRDSGFCEAMLLPVDAEGHISLETYITVMNKLEQRGLNDKLDILVSMQMANNVVGTLQPIEKLCEIAHNYGAKFHTDATQVFGHMPLSVEETRVDALSASAQKLHGLKGTGFLYKKSGFEIDPIIYGTQENELRGGTENVIGIIAFGEAVKNIDYSKTNDIAGMRDYMIRLLEESFYCTINGDRHQRLPNNISITLKELGSSESLIYALDLSDIYVSAGSACESRTLKSDHVLKALGKSIEDVHKTIRITLGEDINKAKIDKTVDEIAKQMSII